MRTFILIMVIICIIMGGLIVKDHRAIIELKRESGLNEKLMIDLNKRLIKLTFKRIDIVATGYCLCDKCINNPAWRDGKTSTGMNANINVIAVDPTIIPYGSMVYIDGLGVYIAGDTGSKIKGNRVDIFFNTHQEALNFGVKRFTAWVL